MKNKKIGQNTQNMEIRSVNLEINNTQTDEDNRTIEGYASVFSDDYTLIRDRWGDKFFEKIERGAFAKTIADETRNVVMIVDHDYTRIVGRKGINLELKEDERGLYVKCKLPKTTEGNDLLENIRSGLISGMSFGFNIVTDKVRWDDDYNMYRDIKEVQLNEVTATAYPCYDDTELNITESRSKLQNKKSDKGVENTEIEEEEKRAKVNVAQQKNINMLISFVDAFTK